MPAPFTCLSVLPCGCKGLLEAQPFDVLHVYNFLDLSPLLASSYQEVDLFSEIRSSDFNAAFGNTASVPSSTSAGPTNVSLNQYTMGDMLTPQAVGQHATVKQKEEPKPKSLTTDVDSSLAAAAANLSMFSPQQYKTNPWEGKPVCREGGRSSAVLVAWPVHS